MTSYSPEEAGTGGVPPKGLPRIRAVGKGSVRAAAGNQGRSRAFPVQADAARVKELASEGVSGVRARSGKETGRRSRWLEREVGVK